MSTNVIWIHVFLNYLDPIIVSFDGFQWLWIKFSPLPIQSSVEELTLRFRTKYEDGFLLTTRSSILSAPDCLELKIISGYLSLIYNLGAIDNVSLNIYLSKLDCHFHSVLHWQLMPCYANFWFNIEFKLFLIG